MRNQQNVKVRVNSSFETICPFPVGYVYMSSNSTSPGSIYGGTWASISGGRYMRAASAWGNGGSNTITQDNLPSHRHGIALTYNVSPGAGATVPAWLNGAPNRQYTDFTGGGQHSIPLTKTFGRGTEQPKEGERLCVTSKQFKSGLAARLKRFVHSQLASSICQPIQQVQQALTEVRGHLSQIVGSCGQAVRGILQVEQVRTRTITGCHSAKKMAFQAYRLLALAVGQMERRILCVQQRLLTVFLQKIPILVQVVEMQQNQPLITKLFQRFHLTAPAIAGIVPLKVGEC